MLNQRTQYTWWSTSSLHGSEIELRGKCAQKHRYYPLVKRLMDVIIAAVALVLAAPLMVLIALAIKLDTPGPIFHVQSRTGKSGRTFRFYKFRSMTNGVDHTEEHRKFAAAYINGRPVAAAQDDNGRVLYKPASNGHKITWVGRWLRQTSLDELPQLLNVLKGDMSLVGPRPTMDYETSLYTDRHRIRLEAVPGLTGWAQIHGRSGLSFDEIVSLDIEYIEQCSLLLDLKVLWATIPVVLNAEHAG
jgi:lipopolysaccharide/colanic/teichoic acid biosynthesis glycosyltransferase